MSHISTIERYSFHVTRANCGKIKLPRPINNIRWVKVSNVIFRHGPKKKIKKSRKKKYDSDDDDDDIPFEHGNPDLNDSTMILIKINDFIRATRLDVDGERVGDYTVVIFNDIDESTGEGDWSNGCTTRSDEYHDWDAFNSKLRSIDHVDIHVSTDLNPNATHINLEIEVEFGIDDSTK